MATERAVPSLHSDRYDQRKGVNLFRSRVFAASSSLKSRATTVSSRFESGLARDCFARLAKKMIWRGATCFENLGDCF